MLLTSTILSLSVAACATGKKESVATSTQKGFRALASQPAECLDPQSNVEMKMCESARIDKFADEYRTVYKAEQDRLEKAGYYDFLISLRKSEGERHEFQNALCSVAGLTMFGGTGEGLAYGGCLASAESDNIREFGWAKSIAGGEDVDKVHSSILSLSYRAQSLKAKAHKVAAKIVKEATAALKKTDLDEWDRAYQQEVKSRVLTLSTALRTYTDARCGALERYSGDATRKSQIREICTGIAAQKVLAYFEELGYLASGVCQ